MCRAPGISSFIRLIERRKVDLPQPDGPMSAVTARGAIVEVDVVQRLLLAVPEGEVLDRRSRPLRAPVVAIGPATRHAAAALIRTVR